MISCLRLIVRHTDSCQKTRAVEVRLGRPRNKVQLTESHIDFRHGLARPGMQNYEALSSWPNFVPRHHPQESRLNLRRWPSSTRLISNKTRPRGTGSTCHTLPLASSYRRVVSMRPFLEIMPLNLGQTQQLPGSWPKMEAGKDEGIPIHRVESVVKRDAGSRDGKRGI